MSIKLTKKLATRGEKMKKFGEFIAEKRKSREITLRGMAEQLDISPAYLSDIEKSRRNPPDLALLEKIAEVLNLSQEDKETMFELAGQDREEIPPDLPGYIMEKPTARKALRLASNKGTPDEFWEAVIKKLDEE
jgi:transcriptional regulator with XRE-family HTH domain